MPSAVVLVVAAALLVAAVFVFAVAGRARRGAIPAGRLGRLARVGRLSARLATSSVGARARRLVAGRDRRERDGEARRRRDAQAVARTMGEMKGAFMKLGQMLWFVSDAVPPEYRAALESLQAEAPPLGFGAVRDVVERELGGPLERAFARFEREPVASASIGQVHRARLPGGDDVAVKVQYPGVAAAIGADLANFTMYVSVRRPVGVTEQVEAERMRCYGARGFVAGCGAVRKEMPVKHAARQAGSTLAISLFSILSLLACSSEPASTGGAQRKPAGTTHDPVDVCEKVGDVCRLDGARLGVCTQPPAGSSPAACAGRNPCYLCTSQH